MPGLGSAQFHLMSLCVALAVAASLKPGKHQGLFRPLPVSAVTTALALHLDTLRWVRGTSHALPSSTATAIGSEPEAGCVWEATAGRSFIHSRTVEAQSAVRTTRPVSGAAELCAQCISHSTHHPALGWGSPPQGEPGAQGWLASYRLPGRGLRLVFCPTGSMGTNATGQKSELEIWVENSRKELEV